MPISKTCYFCDLYPSGMIECDGNRFTKECFTPNADWIYIEQLEKENESLKKKNEELKNLKDITKSFAERCRIIFTHGDDIPPAIQEEYMRHTQYEYDEIKRLIDIIEKDEVKA
jgi:hypothetical protein